MWGGGGGGVLEGPGRGERVGGTEDGVVGYRREAVHNSYIATS